jgi:small-conductance mechanosensitive channel
MLNQFIPVAYAFGVSFLTLSLLQYVLITRRTDLKGEALLPRQLFMFACFLVAVIVIVIMLPIPESTQNQILALLGLLISGVIAFSSTAFVTSVMAAIMLRVTRPFTVGDFITLGDKFGKVSARGLFDTEIQTESGELIAIPNALFVSEPVKVVHDDGMIISTSLSLGYDIHHVRIEELLVSAAKQTELRDPYVRILELGDFSVTYQVSGFLAEPKTLLTCQSRLNAKVLDTLHGAGIEVMSPNFARHISHSGDKAMIPANIRRNETKSKSSAEDVAFAKANQAEAEKQKKKELQESIAEVKAAIETAAEDTVDQLKDKLGKLENQLTSLNQAASDTESK